MQVDYIQTEVARMPEPDDTPAVPDKGAAAGGPSSSKPKGGAEDVIISEPAPSKGGRKGSGNIAAGGSTYIPPIFRLPAGVEEMEVVDCFSDSE
jgi:hypothetical protein